MNALAVLPLLLCLRMEGSQIAGVPDIERWQALDSNGENVDPRTLVLRQSRPTYRDHVELHVAPDQDYSVVRYAILRDEQEAASRQIEIEYEKQGGIFLPRRWQSTIFSRGGSVSEQDNVDVVAFVVNPALDESVFRLDFPPDTRVLEFNLKPSIPLFPILPDQDQNEHRFWYVDSNRKMHHIDRQMYDATARQGPSAFYGRITETE
jgi:hypothetical protein